MMRFNKPNRTALKIVLIVSTLTLVVGLAYYFVIRPKSIKNPTSPAQITKQDKSVKTAQPDHIRLIATGDTIAHDALNAAAKQADGSYNYYQFMKPMQALFDKSDVRFCNQAVPGGGTQFGIYGYPVFNSPLEVANRVPHYCLASTQANQLLNWLNHVRPMA